MKKKTIIYFLCLFCMVNTIHGEGKPELVKTFDTTHGQGKLERIKTFEVKEKQADQDMLDAENKLNTEKPGHEANKILWENKAEEIRINHGSSQHVVGTSEAIYWRGEYDNANKQAASYQEQIDVLQGAYNTKKSEKEQVVFEKNEAIKSYLDSLNSTAIPAPCQNELANAQADLSSVTSSSLESLSHCWSSIFDNAKKGLKGIDGFLEVPSSFGSTDVVALTSADMAAAEEKRKRIAAEMAKSTPTPKIPITAPPPLQSSPAEAATPSLSDRLKEIIKYMKKLGTPTPVKTPTAVLAVRG
jgi:hypothetical protein